ncbi:hypothetical protein DL771_001211 [Monosporascus sp. 5C6A]|nr:hypothetical protein DL771_001211 [Monosporascus sp. 5C6A]
MGASQSPAAPTTQPTPENPCLAVTENDTGRLTFDKNAYRKAPVPTPSRVSTPRATKAPATQQTPKNPCPAVTGNEAGHYLTSDVGSVVPSNNSVPSAATPGSVAGKIQPFHHSNAFSSSAPLVRTTTSF